MTDERVTQLPDGIYLLLWEHGGASVAAVGRDENGYPWFAPTNWVHVPSTTWGMVRSVELLTTQARECAERNL